MNSWIVCMLPLILIHCQTVYSYWNQSCSFLNYRNVCTYCEIVPYDHQKIVARDPQAHRSPPPPPANVQVIFLGDGKMFEEKNSDIAVADSTQRNFPTSGLTFIITHPLGTSSLRGYFIQIQVNQNLQAPHSEPYEPYKFSVSFTPMSYDDKPLKVDIPLTEILAYRKTENPSYWLNRELQLSVCSQPSLKATEKGNCYNILKFPNALSLPNVTEEMMGVEKAAKSCGSALPPFSSKESKDRRQSKSRLVIFTVVVSCCVLVPILLCFIVFVFINKKGGPSVKATWRRLVRGVSNNHAMHPCEAHVDHRQHHIEFNSRCPKCKTCHFNSSVFTLKKNDINSCVGGGCGSLSDWSSGCDIQKYLGSDSRYHQTIDIDYSHGDVANIRREDGLSNLSTSAELHETESVVDSDNTSSQQAPSSRLHSQQIEDSCESVTYDGYHH